MVGFDRVFEIYSDIMSGEVVLIANNLATEFTHLPDLLRITDGARGENEFFSQLCGFLASARAMCCEARASITGSKIISMLGPTLEKP